MGTDKVSDRYIQNMHLEIPLPPGVTFVSSPLEGGTAGEKISASADKTTIFYDRDVYQYGTEIKFRMRLDYTGINNGGSDLTQKIFSDWFNLYNNSTSIKERQQFGKPWKFTGKIYGIPQELSFNDRSVLRLDIDTQSVRVWSNNNANKDYSQAGNYVINNDMKDSADNARTWFRVLAPQYVYPTHYTRQSVFTMDWGIQLTSVVISNWSSEPSGKAELIFFTNKGRKFQQTVSGQESYSVPALDTGEYVTKLAVQATEINDLVELHNLAFTLELNGRYGIAGIDDYARRISSLESKREHVETPRQKDRITAQITQLEQAREFVREKALLPQQRPARPKRQLTPAQKKVAAQRSQSGYSYGDSRYIDRGYDQPSRDSRSR